MNERCLLSFLVTVSRLLFFHVRRLKKINLLSLFLMICPTVSTTESLKLKGFPFLKIKRNRRICNSSDGSKFLFITNCYYGKKERQ